VHSIISLKSKPVSDLIGSRFC